MVKLIQICASQNDLFGLDGDGSVYQYNFKASTWTKLGQGWGNSGESRLVERPASSGEPKMGVSVAPPKG
jgi:hypothetical protein